MKKIFPLFILILLALGSCEKADTTASSGTTGVGGSMARFTISMNHLYIVDQAHLYTYSLAIPNHPQIKSTIDLSWDIETIYPFKDKLFIGSQNGMMVYSLTNPDNPELLGAASHVRSCDPVVANDTVAYSTIRGGSRCGGDNNALIVYSVTDVVNPVQRNMINLNSPFGLGLGSNNKRLYVCNGTSGLIVYDLADPLCPKFIKNITGEHFYDIIVLDDMLVCMVENGTAIYTVQPGDVITPAGKISN